MTVFNISNDNLKHFQRQFSIFQFLKKHLKKIYFLKLPFRYELINLLKKLFKKLAYIYHNKC